MFLTCSSVARKRKALSISHRTHILSAESIHSWNPGLKEISSQLFQQFSYPGCPGMVSANTKQRLCKAEGEVLSLPVMFPVNFVLLLITEKWHWALSGRSKKLRRNKEAHHRGASPPQIPVLALLFSCENAAGYGSLFPFIFSFHFYIKKNYNQGKGLENIRDQCLWVEI